MSLKNTIIALGLGSVLSAITLYFAFRNVPFADLTNYILSINYIWLLPAVGILIVAFLGRVWRWQIIVGASTRLSFINAYHPLVIGFMINCVLPGRVGEVARPVLLQKKDHIPFSTGLATVAAERTLDLTFLILFLMLSMIFVEIDPDLNLRFGEYHLNRQTLEAVFRGALFFLSLTIIGIGMVAIGPTRTILIRIIAKTPVIFGFAGPSIQRRISATIIPRVIRIIENFADGFSLVKKPRRLIAGMLLSVAVWLLHALSFYLISIGCPGIELGFAEISVTMIILCFFISLPSVPGYWGLWEAGGVYGLLLFGVPYKEAAGLTLTNHAIQIIPLIIIGMISAAITGVNIWKVSYGEKQLQERSATGPIG